MWAHRIPSIPKGYILLDLQGYAARPTVGGPWKAATSSHRPTAVDPGGSPPTAAEAAAWRPILQDHALGWAIVVAFAAWLIHDIVIAGLSKQ